MVTVGTLQNSGWAGSRLTRSDRLFPSKKIHAAPPRYAPAADACAGIARENVRGNGVKSGSGRRM